MHFRSVVISISAFLALRKIGMPLGYILAAVGTSIIVIAIAIGYTVWTLCRRHKNTIVWKNISEKDSFPKSVYESNLKISKSTPDLASEINKASNDQRYSKAKLLFKSFRQSTLPVVSERHQLFQRQISHQLDLSQIEFSVQRTKHSEQPCIGSIKPELYKQPSTESILSEHSECGQLHYSLKYDSELEQLIVEIIQATNLPPKDFSMTSDPYVKTYLLPDRRQKFQSKVQRKTLNPEFHEKHAFSVSFKELAERVLQFNIYDFDRFSRHDLIGTVTVPEITTEGCRRLETETFFIRDIIAFNQKELDLGELMVTLCYLPTAGRLTLTIVKGRNLKAMDITGSSDPYVKVYLFCQNKRIKKKKTSVKKNNLNPVYNEAMVFDVPQENIDDVDLIMKVIDYDRVGFNEIMGCCAIGPRCDGTDRDHWFEMLENTRKPVAHWHSLREHVKYADSNSGAKCKVVVSGLLPRGGTNVKPFNIKLKILCDKMKVAFIDYHDSFIMAQKHIFMQIKLI